LGYINKKEFSPAVWAKMRAKALERPAKSEQYEGIGWDGMGWEVKWSGLGLGSEG